MAGGFTQLFRFGEQPTTIGLDIAPDSFCQEGVSGCRATPGITEPHRFVISVPFFILLPLLVLVTYLGGDTFMMILAFTPHVSRHFDIMSCSS